MQTKLQRAIESSHAAQLRGVDYQAAAIDAATEFGFGFESDEYTEIQGSPSEDCDCAACRAFDWPTD